MTKSHEFLAALLKASEKAANIARVCRQNEALFNLLVQEKTDSEKNPRFFQDFKTLADVLIQESVRHDIGSQFPDIAKMVKGEETNVFSNTLGKTVIVRVCSTCMETTNLLTQVLDNDEHTAMLLATEIHRDISINEVPIDNIDLNSYHLDIDINDVGIWIDPIDSTADYISANTLIDELTGLHLSGLRCVTVLIGAYSRKTSLPVLGVVNQPFYSSTGESQYKGACYWGAINEDGSSQISYSKPENLNQVIVISRAEDPTVKAKLSNDGFKLIEVAGAGYKILSVAIGLADAYVLSKKSTYRWDTCAPQGLLRSLGGDILDFTKFTSEGVAEELKYSGEETDFSNSGGLIAYRDHEVLNRLKKILVLSTKL